MNIATYSQAPMSLLSTDADEHLQQSLLWMIKVLHSKPSAHVFTGQIY